MPDDRELTGTHASGQLLKNQLPGIAATDELVVSRQSETLDSDDWITGTEALRRVPDPPEYPSPARHRRPGT